MTEGLDVVVKDRVCWITLDRPKKLNSLTPEMMHGLRKVFTDIDDDPEVCVAVLRGAGEKGFCAGMDLDWSESLTKADRIEQGRLGENIRPPRGIGRAVTAQGLLGQAAAGQEHQALRGWP